MIERKFLILEQARALPTNVSFLVNIELVLGLGFLHRKSVDYGIDFALDLSAIPTTSQYLVNGFHHEP